MFKSPAVPRSTRISSRSSNPHSAQVGNAGLLRNPSLSPPTLAVLAFSVLWCILWFVHSWAYWEDDSFIHLEFARSLADGRGFAFNGSVVYGDTAPLWVMLLAAFHLAIPDWLAAGKLLALLGTILAVTGVFAFSRRLTASRSSGGLFPTVMVLLFVLNPYFCYWSFSGMETVTAAGLALWAVVAATNRPLHWNQFLLGCALAGAAPLLRPELCFFTAILAPFLLYRRYAASTIESATPFLLPSLAKFAAAIVLLTGPALAWAAYALHTFGRIIPNTNAAKRAPIGDSILLRLLNVYSLGYPVILLALLAGLVYLALHASSMKESTQSLRRSTVFQQGGWIFVLWTAITLAFYIVNHTYVQTRYILVSAVGLTIVAFAGLSAVAPRAYRLCLTASLLLATLLSVLPAWLLVRNKTRVVEAVQQQANFLRTQLPDNALVADYNIGEIAFFSEHPILDTGGITRPGAIPFLNAPFSDLMGWIHSQNGTYMVYDRQPEPGAVLVLSQPLPFVSWTLDPRRYAHIDQLNLWKLPTPVPEAAPPPATPSSHP